MPAMSRYLARAHLPRAIWGYRVSEVNFLIAMMRRALVQIELGGTARLTPEQVSTAEFGMRLFGYRHGPVDELLDQVTARLGEVAPAVRNLNRELVHSKKVKRVQFPRRLRGYSKKEVLASCNRLADVLEQWERGERPVGLVAEDLVSVRYPGSWFGLDRAQVDEFLDEAAATLSAWQERKPRRS